jgi:hypothetical protein
MRRITSPSLPRSSEALRNSFSPLSAVASILASLSNTAHSTRPRRNTAAGVGAANGKSMRRLSPCRCSATVTGAFGLAGSGGAAISLGFSAVIGGLPGAIMFGGTGGAAGSAMVAGVVSGAATGTLAGAAITGAVAGAFASGGGAAGFAGGGVSGGASARASAA